MKAQKSRQEANEKNVPKTIDAESTKTLLKKPANNPFARRQLEPRSDLSQPK